MSKNYSHAVFRIACLSSVATPFRPFTRYLPLLCKCIDQEPNTVPRVSKVLLLYSQPLYDVFYTSSWGTGAELWLGFFADSQAAFRNAFSVFLCAAVLPWSLVAVALTVGVDAPVVETLSLESSVKVTGPSLTSPTLIIAPNWPSITS